MKDQLYIVSSLALVVVAISIGYLAFFYLPSSSVGKTAFDSCFNRCVSVGVPPNGGKCEDGRVTGTLKQDIGADYKKGDTWCYTSEAYCFSACNQAKSSQ